MSATAALHIDRRYTSLELIGGKFCDIGNDNIRPDLIVHGGAHIGAASCFDGLVYMRKDLTVEGNLTVLQNVYQSNIYSTEIFTNTLAVDHIIAPSPCLDIQGNVCISGTLSSTEVFTNTIAVDHIIAPSPCLDIQGNVCQTGILSSTDIITNSLTVDQIVAPSPCLDIQGNVCISGSLSGPTPCLDIQGNVCISGTINYVVGNAAVWSPPAPTTVQSALDRLAQQVYFLGANTPIP